MPAGLGDEARRRLEAMEAQSRSAAERLVNAASQGTLLTFNAALAAASKYSHLEALVAQAREGFEARRAAAEAAVQEAAQGGLQRSVGASLCT